ncbi:MAG TPA: glycosyltransferase family 4 protein [Thermoanaerobaculia bacterium]|nr:glycosyltransferase family 4 protein [Thermoanaerobaculia bacterium]
MKILHLAAGNRWTGAAAPAFSEVEALRAAGIEAHYAYVGGYKLQTKLAGVDFAHPIIEKAQNPMAFIRSIRAIRRLVVTMGIDVLHSHLTYDQSLARFAARVRGRRNPLLLARTYHSQRTLRNDSFTSSFVRRSDSIFIINDTFRDAPLLRDRPVTFTPPPLDTRLFKPDGPDVRAQYGISPDAQLMTVIGKLSAGRGFEEAMRTFAVVRRENDAARLMIIGHGEHRPHLERLGRELGVAADVLFAGYHEDDLPEHYRAADVLLFTAAGSDEGHRAIIEALGCGIPVATFPIPGVHALLTGLAAPAVASDSTPESLAAVVRAIFALPPRSLRSAAAAHAAQFTFGPAARRLLEGYAAR